MKNKFMTISGIILVVLAGLISPKEPCEIFSLADFVAAGLIISGCLALYLGLRDIINKFWENL